MTEKTETVELTRHEKILIGNALQVYCANLSDMLEDRSAFAFTKEAKQYLTKCLEDAELLKNKFSEW